MSTKFYLLFLGTFASVAFLAAIGFGFLRKDTGVFQTQSPEVTTIPPSELISTKADWQTYRNIQYGFELKYPSHWTLVEREDLRDSDMPLIFLESESGATLSILPRGGFDYGNGPVLSRENILISGHLSVEVNSGLLADGSQLVTLHIEDWFPENRIEIRTSNRNVERQLVESKEIISTLRFFGGD